MFAIILRISRLKSGYFSSKYVSRKALQYDVNKLLMTHSDRFFFIFEMKNMHDCVTKHVSRVTQYLDVLFLFCNMNESRTKFLQANNKVNTYSE
jgi:hypothetical protein